MKVRWHVYCDHELPKPDDATSKGPWLCKAETFADDPFYNAVWVTVDGKDYCPAHWPA